MEKQENTVFSSGYQMGFLSCALMMAVPQKNLIWINVRSITLVIKVCI